MKISRNPSAVASGPPKPRAPMRSTSLLLLLVVITTTVSVHAVCSPVCSSHGTCVSDVCVCASTWHGTTCSLSICGDLTNECNGHGTCQTNGICACSPIAFTGDTCLDRKACFGTSTWVAGEPGNFMRLSAIDYSDLFPMVDAALVNGSLRMVEPDTESVDVDYARWQIRTTHLGLLRFSVQHAVTEEYLCVGDLIPTTDFFDVVLLPAYNRTRCEFQYDLTNFLITTKTQGEGPWLQRCAYGNCGSHEVVAIVSFVGLDTASIFPIATGCSCDPMCVVERGGCYNDTCACDFAWEGAECAASVQCGGDSNWEDGEKGFAVTILLNAANQLLIDPGSGVFDLSPPFLDDSVQGRWDVLSAGNSELQFYVQNTGSGLYATASPDDDDRVVTLAALDLIDPTSQLWAFNVSVGTLSPVWNLSLALDYCSSCVSGGKVVLRPVALVASNVAFTFHPSACTCDSNCGEQHAGCVADECACSDGWAGVPPNCTVSPCAQIMPNCHGNGECSVDGDCVCDDTWVGTSCNVSICSNTTHECQDHGTCLDSGDCDCNIGWFGPVCNTSVCSTVTPVCHGHGHCDATDGNRCDCALPWTGRWCNISACSNTTLECSGHGACQDSHECECDFRWTDTLCNVTICSVIDDTCTGHGICSNGDGCLCSDGWHGDWCDISDCSNTTTECTGHGICPGNGTPTCVCDQGWMGRLCSVSFCSLAVHPICTGHGHCRSTGHGDCVCDTGWSGTWCNISTCSNTTIECAGHGDCGVSATCTCDPSWVGALCTAPLCSIVLIDTDTECYGHGLCDNSNPLCACDEAWDAPFCNVSLCSGTTEECSGHGNCSGTIVYQCACEDGWFGLLCDSDVPIDISSSSSSTAEDGESSSTGDESSSTGDTDSSSSSTAIEAAVVNATAVTSTGLSTGAIVGIAVGVPAALALAAVGAGPIAAACGVGGASTGGAATGTAVAHSTATAVAPGLVSVAPFIGGRYRARCEDDDYL